VIPKGEGRCVLNKQEIIDRLKEIRQEIAEKRAVLTEESEKCLRAGGHLCDRPDLLEQNNAIDDLFVEELVLLKELKDLGVDCLDAEDLEPEE